MLRRQQTVLLFASLQMTFVFFQVGKAIPAKTKTSPSGLYQQKKLLCDSPLGLSTGFIQESQIKVSSSARPTFDSRSVRLNTAEYAWCPTPGRGQYVQIDFGKRYQVTGVATQGMDGYINWVTKYIIKYSDDGLHWKLYAENGKEKIFIGNSDAHKVVRNNFAKSVFTRYFRLELKEWVNSPCLRMEVYGCHDACESPLGMTTGAIPTANLASASDFNEKQDYRFSRLNAVNLYDNTSSRAWVARVPSNAQYLQIDIGYETTVKYVATQGRSRNRENQCCDMWVTSYEVHYSRDGYDWKIHSSSNGQLINKFTGNHDNYGIVRHTLSPPITARFIRIVSKTWRKRIALRAEIFGCPKVCDLPLGMTTGAIADHQIRSSSNYNSSYNTRGSRLLSYDSRTIRSGWCAKTADTRQWMQINFEKKKTITAVATQGRADADEWVTSYQIAYSTDGSNWIFYKDEESREPKMFDGNSDRESVVKNSFGKGIYAQSIRIRPQSWHGSKLCLRAEFYGCA
eukprot:m.3048 g.3048  ORF g.3048 m.3048 type:complete len:513 (+) comp9027_c0_seq1:429-1967(+)